MITVPGPIRTGILALDAAGWVALYTLAIGGVVGALVWAVSYVMRRRSATARYVLAWGALACVAVVPVPAAMAIHGAYGGHGPLMDRMAGDLMERAAPRPGGPLPGGWDRSTLTDAVAAGHAQVQVLPLGGRQGLWLGNAMSVLGLAWLLGAGIGLWRLACDWRAVDRLRRRPGCAADRRWVRIMEEVAARLRVRRAVDIRVTDEVDGPVLVGWRHPVVFLPSDTHRSLSDDGAEAILAHELAHVRASDFAVNLLQSAVEAVMNHHPAVRWLGTRIRHEREYRADAVALSGIRGSVKSYAITLTTLEESRAGYARRGAGAVAAHGGELLRRIQRLSGDDARARSRRMALWEVALITAALLASAATLSALPRRGVVAAHALMAHDLGLPRDYLGIARDRGLIGR